MLKRSGHPLSVLYKLCIAVSRKSCHMSINKNPMSLQTDNCHSILRIQLIQCLLIQLIQCRFVDCPTLHLRISHVAAISSCASPQWKSERLTVQLGWRFLDLLRRDFGDLLWPTQDDYEMTMTILHQRYSQSLTHRSHSLFLTKMNSPCLLLQGGSLAMILDHPSTGPGGGTLRSSLRQWPNNRWVPPERSNQFRRHLVVDLLEDLNINFENSHTRINHKMMGLSIFPRYTNEGLKSRFTTRKIFKV